MKYSKDELEKYILVDRKSYKEIGEIYGCTDSNIRKVSRRLGIKLPNKRKINSSEHFNKGIYRRDRVFCLNCGEDITHKYKNKYCNVSCQHEYQKKEKISYYYNNQKLFENDIIYTNWLKPMILNEQKNLCGICKIKSKWNNKKLIFVLDHIDGNAANNKRNNLRCVCPNCDSQLDTFKSKNKNSARKERYLRNYKN